MREILFVGKNKVYYHDSDTGVDIYKFRIYSCRESTEVTIEGEKNIFYTSFSPTKQDLLLMYEEICFRENRIFDSKKYNMLLDLYYLKGIKKEYKTIEDKYKLKELEYMYEGLYSNDEDYQKAFQEVEEICT